MGFRTGITILIVFCITYVAGVVPVCAQAGAPAPPATDKKDQCKTDKKPKPHKFTVSAGTHQEVKNNKTTAGLAWKISGDGDWAETYWKVDFSDTATRTIYSTAIRPLRCLHKKGDTPNTLGKPIPFVGAGLGYAIQRDAGEDPVGGWTIEGAVGLRYNFDENWRMEFSYVPKHFYATGLDTSDISLSVGYSFALPSLR